MLDLAPELSPERTLVAAMLGLGVVTFSCLPVMIHFGHAQPLGWAWDRWVYLALLSALLHFAYVIYFVLWPERWALWLFALMVVAQAGAMAVLLAIFTFSAVDSAWVARLDLADAHQSGRVTKWCLVMLLVNLGLASALRHLAVTLPRGRPAAWSGDAD